MTTDQSGSFKGHSDSEEPAIDSDKRTVSLEEIQRQARARWADDPEVQALLPLSVGELRRIRRDPQDPRHAAAQRYSAEVNRVIRSGLAKITQAHLYPYRFINEAASGRHGKDVADMLRSVGYPTPSLSKAFADALDERLSNEPGSDADAVDAALDAATNDGLTVATFDEFISALGGMINPIAQQLAALSKIQGAMRDASEVYRSAAEQDRKSMSKATSQMRWLTWVVAVLTLIMTTVAVLDSQDSAQNRRSEAPQPTSTDTTTPSTPTQTDKADPTSTPDSE